MNMMVGTAISGAVVPQPADATNDAIFDLIEAHRKAVAAVRAAEAESSRLFDLANKTVGECKVVIPDMRRSHHMHKDERDWHLPVVRRVNGVDYVEAALARQIDEYLPYVENAELRDRHKKRLEAIETAHREIFDDKWFDEAFRLLCAAESEAVDALLETPPSTAAGLLALLAYWGEAREADNDVLAEHHLEPLIMGLASAAASLGRF